jgi:CHAD domain-containing protein
MKHHVTSAYVSACLKSVEKHLSGFGKDKDSEHLHRLRVDIKKVRAILSLIQIIYGNKINARPIRKLFDDAGKIRVYEITLSNPQLLKVAPPYLIYQLEKTRDILQQEFAGKIRQYIKSVRSFRKQLGIECSFPGKKMFAGYLLYKKIRAVEMFDIHQRKDLHRFRKEIKEIMYVYDLVPDKIRRYIFLNTELISKLQNDVGEWHDTFTVVRLLSDYRTPALEQCILQLSLKEVVQFNDLERKYKPLSL